MQSDSLCAYSWFPNNSEWKKRQQLMSVEAQTGERLCQSPSTMDSNKTRHDCSSFEPKSGKIFAVRRFSFALHIFNMGHKWHRHTNATCSFALSELNYGHCIEDNYVLIGRVGVAAASKTFTLQIRRDSQFRANRPYIISQDLGCFNHFGRLGLPNMQFNTP